MDSRWGWRDIFDVGFSLIEGVSKTDVDIIDQRLLLDGYFKGETYIQSVIDMQVRYK